MDPPIEGVDGGSDPPLAYGLRAPPRAADPAEDMQTMQREPGDAQPRDERPADAYLTGSGIAAPAAPEPLDTTREASLSQVPADHRTAHVLGAD